MTILKTTLAALAASAMTLSAAWAQDYPNGTVEMIVPFSAGGGTDSVARIFEPPFSEALGATVVIRNIDGASGTIGAATAAKAKPDGYTIGYLPIGPVAIQPVLRPLDYDADSWDYICQTTDNPVFVMVSKESGITSLDELKEKGQLIYGSSGPGTIPHLAMAAVSGALGVEATHVPYDGTGPAMNALAGGEIGVFADQPNVVRSNDVTPLAILAEERHPEFPDVPTASELGYDGLDFSIWQGIVVPAGTDTAIQDKLSAACKSALESDTFMEAAAKASNGLRYRDPAEFEAFVRRNMDTNRTILQEAGLVQ